MWTGFTLSKHLNPASILMSTAFLKRMAWQKVLQHLLEIVLGHIHEGKQSIFYFEAVIREFSAV